MTKYEFELARQNIHLRCRQIAQSWREALKLSADTRVQLAQHDPQLARLCQEADEETIRLMERIVTHLERKHAELQPN